MKRSGNGEPGASPLTDWNSYQLPENRKIRSVEMFACQDGCVTEQLCWRCPGSSRGSCLPAEMSPANIFNASPMPCVTLKGAVGSLVQLLEDVVWCRVPAEMTVVEHCSAAFRNYFLH